MIFYVDSSGQVQCVSPKTVKQGSVGVSKIRLFGAFAPNNTVMLAFELPHGQWTTPQYMAKPFAGSCVEAKDGTKYYIWEYALGGTVTAISGVVKVQFFVYDGTDESTMLSSGIGSFMVEKGVPITIPKPSEEMNELLTQINNFLAASDPKALTMGAGRTSVEQQPFVYDGENVDFSDGTKGTQKGDTVPGAEAKGEQSVALGGLRWDYYTNAQTLADNKEVKATYEEHFGRTPTSAEGKQSFAAGGSVHAYGDWSVAIGKDTKAYHRGSFSAGGGTVAGRTKEEWDSLPNGLKYKPTYDQDYSFAVALGESTTAKGRSAMAVNNRTTASGEFSFSANIETSATAIAAASFGRNTVADSENQVAIGSCNKRNSGALFSIGCGTSDSDRKDALRVHSHYIQLGQADQIFSDNNTLRLPNSIYTKDDAALTLEGKGASFSSDEIALTNKKVKVGGEHTLSANNTFAAGSGNKVKNDCGIALGQGLTSNNWTQVVVGSYNKENAAARFIVGNGTTAHNSEGVWVNTPSTAFEVLGDGRAKVYGVPKEDNDVVTKAYADTKVQSLKGASGTKLKVYVYDESTQTDVVKTLVCDLGNSEGAAHLHAAGYYNGRLVTATPQNPYQAANKKYVDEKAGGTPTVYPLTNSNGVYRSEAPITLGKLMTIRLTKNDGSYIFMPAVFVPTYNGSNNESRVSVTLYQYDGAAGEYKNVELIAKIQPAWTSNYSGYTPSITFSEDLTTLLYQQEYDKTLTGEVTVMV